MSRGLLIWKSALVFLTFVAGGAVLTETVGAVPAGLFVLAVGGANAATDFYTNSVTTANKDVVLARAGGGVVAGEAAAQKTGSPAYVEPGEQGVDVAVVNLA